jgi:hypothetical protein
MEAFDIRPLPGVENASAIDEDMGPVINFLLCYLVLKGTVILSAPVRERLAEQHTHSRYPRLHPIGLQEPSCSASCTSCFLESGQLLAADIHS